MGAQKRPETQRPSVKGRRYRKGDRDSDHGDEDIQIIGGRNGIFSSPQRWCRFWEKAIPLFSVDISSFCQTLTILKSAAGVVGDLVVIANSNHD